MARIIKCLLSPAAATVVLCTVLYWLAAQFLKPHNMIELLDGIIISLSLSVFLAYGLRFRKGIFEHRPSASDLVIAGISLGWLTQGIERSWRLISRVFDWGWMIEHAIIGYFLTLMAISAAMHLMVKGAVQGDSIGVGAAPRAWSSIIVALILGLALGSLAIAVDHALLGR